MKILKYLLISLSLSLFANFASAASILEMYRGSIQEKMLDAQIKAYRSKAILNAKTFGGAYSNDPNYNRHVGLEKLRKVLPSHVNKDNIPAWRTKKGGRQPHPKLNDVGRIKKSAYISK